MAYLSEYPVTQPYKPNKHFGVDYATPIRTPLPCLETGIVKFAGWTQGVNNTKELLMVVQCSGFYIVYGHLSEVWNKVGDTVGTAQIIGKTGNSGFTTGPHLHIQEHTGTFTSGIYANPVRDITPRLNAYGGTPMLDELTIRRAVEGAYLESTNALPPKGIIDQKTTYVMENGGFNQVLGDIFSLGVNYHKGGQGGDQQESIDDALTRLSQAGDLLVEAENILAKA